jgi:hypothetical protein
MALPAFKQYAAVVDRRQTQPLHFVTEKQAATVSQHNIGTFGPPMIWTILKGSTVLAC